MQHFCKHLQKKPICGGTADLAMTRLRTEANRTIYRSILKHINTYFFYVHIYIYPCPELLKARLESVLYIEQRLKM